MTFTLYCAGAEVAAHAKVLKAADWDNVALSFWHLRPRLPKKVPWTVAERLPGRSVLLDSGGSAADKQHLTQGDLMAYASALQAFTLANEEALDLIVEFDSLALGPAWVNEQRRGFYADFGDKFVPVWHPVHGLKDLERLCTTHARVGITEDALEEATGLAMFVNGLVTRHGTMLHATASAKPDDLRSVRFATAATGSWLSPTRYGETIFWDGRRLHRYPARLKAEARRRNAVAFTRAGFDGDLILQDDNEEITRLTLWSLKQMEKSVDERRPPLTLITDKSALSPPDPSAEIATVTADNSTPQVRNTPISRDPMNRAVLPVVGFTAVPTREVQPDGSTVIGERLVAKLSASSVRQCDSCFVAATCPAHQPGHECAFNLPVSIETKEQLLAVLNAVIEMQTQRVMFGRFAEELAGGYPDANLSDEIERLFKIVATLKRLEDTNAFIKIGIEARGQAGVLSQIFGERAGALRQLPSPIDADRLIDSTLNGDLDS